MIHGPDLHEFLMIVGHTLQQQREATGRVRRAAAKRFPGAFSALSGRRRMNREGVRFSEESAS